MKESSEPCRSYRLTRRQFVAGGAAGLATLMGMPVRDLLAAAETATRPAAAEHVILLWFGGGLSHLDTFDPKPDAPTGGEFKPIDTAVEGLSVTEILPKLAREMNRAALIRSVHGEIGEHGRATYKALTGYAQRPQLVHPGLGSVVAHEREKLTALPSFVSIGGRAPSPGYLGQACAAYYAGAPGEPDPNLHLPEGLGQARAKQRMRILQRMNERYAEQAGGAQLSATEESYQKARRFMDSPAIEAFNIAKERPAVRAAYGDSSFGRGCLLARRLVESGVRFVQVNSGGFDTHTNNFPAMREKGAEIDPAIASLLSDLAASGKLSRTLVLTLSEFGRTPRINADGGRDHHPEVFSALLAGGGVPAGTVVGASDARGAEPAERPAGVSDIHATVCAALGIDFTKKVQTPLGRPMPLVQGGAPIDELLPKRLRGQSGGDYG
jgi:hypothetical protein